MLKNDDIYIEHIIESLKKIQNYSNAISKEEFYNNTLIQDACIRQFEIIGEAAKKVSDDFKEKHLNIPWKDMAGMRDKLIHDYIDIDIDIVYKTIIDDVIELIIKLEKL